MRRLARYVAGAVAVAAAAREDVASPPKRELTRAQWVKFPKVGSGFARTIIAYACGVSVDVTTESGIETPAACDFERATRRTKANILSRRAFRGRVAATPRLRRGYSVGRRVAATPRLRRGYSVGRRFAATPRLRRGRSADGSRRRRGCDVDTPWGDGPRRRRGGYEVLKLSTAGARRVLAPLSFIKRGPHEGKIIKWLEFPARYFRPSGDAVYWS